VKTGEEIHCASANVVRCMYSMIIYNYNRLQLMILLY